MQLTNHKYSIRIQNFKKNYASVEAVRGVNLKIKKAELFGLIGPDGAGKTTLMRAVCTLLKPSEGQLFINDFDTTLHIRSIRKILGYMPQRFSLYQDLSVEQNLRFFAEVFQVPQDQRLKREKQLYRFSKLGEFKNRSAGALSGGMKQKLALSCALIHTPDILVLDEPTFGVDPVSRHEFWEILSEIKKEGTTIFVSTAYMDEADLCDRVALMHKGEIITSGTPREIKENFPYPLYRISGRDTRELHTYFSGNKLVNNTQIFGDSIHVSFRTKPTKEQWDTWKNELDELLGEWNELEPGIEDVFLEETAGEPT